MTSSVLLLTSFDVGGTERQMVELARRLDPSRFRPHLACFHKRGRLLADLPDLDLLVAADVMERAGAVSVDASLWEATRRALAAETTRLPVISPREGNRFLGTLAIPDVLAAARRADTLS